MQHEIVVGPTGVADFVPRFSYHEVYFLVLSGLSEAPPISFIYGHRVGNVVELAAGDSQGGVLGRGVVGHFTSSDDNLNTIYRTTMWTVANLVTGGMSVDCPPP
jgi:hypothetical protein